jgi:murein DD-endopeptidase MepM/ murein hydrolase activator NlpD
MSRYGNTIIINHNNGYYTLYAHLGIITVSAGDIIDESYLAGGINSLGSAGDHLHFEVLEGPDINQDEVNPFLHITQPDNVAPTIDTTTNHNFTILAPGDDHTLGTEDDEPLAETTDEPFWGDVRLVVQAYDQFPDRLNYTTNIYRIEFEAEKYLENEYNYEDSYQFDEFLTQSSLGDIYNITEPRESDENQNIFYYHTGTWTTNEADGSGNPVYPDGRYSFTVRVSDMNNETT